MQRVTITMEDALLAEVDALVTSHGYQNRSEALRDLARAGLRKLEGPSGDEPSVAALVYVYDHVRRELPRRLINDFHDHYDLAVSTLHVHLNAESCLEVAVLKGSAAAVRHGQLVLLPIRPA